MFWMLFSLACVLIILYMAFDFRNAVESTSRHMTEAECIPVCNAMFGRGSGNSNVSIPTIIINESFDINLPVS